MAIKPRVSAIEASESLSIDDAKQFDAMRASDSEPEIPLEGGEPQKQDAGATATTSTGADPANIADAKDKDVVPLATLLEERKARKEADEKFRLREIEQAKLEERLNLINQALESNKQQPQKPQKLEVPDADKDALGALKALAHNNNLTDEEVRTLRDYKAQREAEDMARQQVSSIANWAAQQEREFIAVNPEYTEASAYLMKSRFDELCLFGNTPEQANQIMHREIIDIANKSRQVGKNPAELTYAFAKARGFTSKATAGAAAGTALTEAEKIAAIAAGQRANRSLGDMSGAAPSSAKLDSKSLASMSDAQFAKVLAAMSPEERMSHLGN